MQSFNHSSILFFIPQFLSLWDTKQFLHGVATILKIFFCCCHTRKLPHVPKLYFGNFHRAFKKSNNYVAAMLYQSFSFSLWVFFHEHSRFTGQQGKGEGIYLTPLYHFLPLHRHSDISAMCSVKWVEVVERS